MKRWLGKPRKYWDVGEDVPFRPSKDRSQRFLEALIRCDGKIHDQFSLDVRDGEITYNQKVGQIAVLYRISLPEGAEDLFRQIMGDDFLTPPTQVHVNDPRGERKPNAAFERAVEAQKELDPGFRLTDANRAWEPTVRTYVLWPYQGVKDHTDGELTSGVMRDLDPALFTNYPGPALDRIMLERRRSQR